MVFQWDKWSTLPHICLHLQGWVCCNYTVPVSLTALLYPIWFISILVKCRTKFIELTGASGWYWTHVNYIRIGLFWSHRLVARVGQHVFSRKKPKSQGFLIVRSWKWEKKMLESGNAQLRMAKKKSDWTCSWHFQFLSQRCFSVHLLDSLFRAEVQSICLFKKKICLWCKVLLSHK